MLFLEVCNNSSILNTILFIKHLIDIIFIVAPIVLVLLLTIDIAKNVISKDDSENKRNINIAIKRVVYCLALFFVPLIIDGVMSFLDNYNVNFATCYDKATEENVQKYYEEEEAKYAKEQEKKEKEREDNKNKIAQEKSDSEISEKAALQKAKQASAQKAKEKQSKGVGDSPSTLDLSGVSSWSEKIALTAEHLAWPYKTPKSKWHYVYGDKKYFSKWSQLTKAKPTQNFMNEMDRVYPGHFKWGTKYPPIRHGQSCDTFVGVVVKASGYDDIGWDYGTQTKLLKKHSKKWKKVSKSNCKRGDICRADGPSFNHTYVILGNNRTAEANFGDDYGVIIKGNCNMCNKGLYRPTQ